MNEVIRIWLNGAKNYQAGVALYSRYGTSDDLKSFFSSGCTPYRETRLLKELTDMVTPSEKEDPVDTEMTTAEPPAAVEITDPVLSKIHEEKVLLHKQKDALRYNLSRYTSDRERGIAAHRILQYRREISAVWEREQYYRQHGHLPDDGSSQINSEHDLKYHRSKANGNARRYRSLLNKYPGNVKYQQLLAKWEAEWQQTKQSIKDQKNTENE
ncbi:hypothetical protein [Chitinophaga ginsengisegetis]|nr:hypothetical protein [Chitinophaga ginsengisegetis]